MSKAETAIEENELELAKALEEKRKLSLAPEVPEPEHFDETWTPPTSTIDDPFAMDNTFPGGEILEESSTKINSERKVIDALLASVPTGQGHYLKLYREITPGQWELKDKIDDFEDWTDLEWQVTDIVRKNTINYPKRWGSGHYKIVVWRNGGLRERFKPIPLWVDANEPSHSSIGAQTNGASSMEDQLSQMATLLHAVKSISPPTPNPADQQKMIADSFLNGIKLTEAKTANADSTNNTMMIAMMTMMSEIFKNNNNQANPMESILTSLLAKPEPIPVNPADTLTSTIQLLSSLGLTNQSKVEPKSMLDTISELKALGLVKLPGNDDPMSKFKEFKDIMGVVSELSGMANGEKTSMTDKIIDIIAPKIPDIVSNVTSTINNVVDAKKRAVLDTMDLSAYTNPNMHPENNVDFTVSNPYDQHITSDNPYNTNFNVPDNASVANVQPNSASMPASTPSNSPPNTAEVTSGNINPSKDNMNIHSLVKHLYKDKFNAIYEYISENIDTPETYEIITAQIYELFPDLIDGLADGSIQNSVIVEFITTYGDSRFTENDMIEKTKAYITKYCNYLTEQFKDAYIVKCNKCNAEYTYASKAYFIAEPEESKVCDNEACKGKLIEITNTNIKIDKGL